jgi:hypothetical protein
MWSESRRSQQSPISTASCQLRRVAEGRLSKDWDRYNPKAKTANNVPDFIINFEIMQSIPIKTQDSRILT